VLLPADAEGIRASFAIIKGKLHAKEKLAVFRQKKTRTGRV
jgi:hypothetical protein